MDEILWLVETGNMHVVVWCKQDREEAKRRARTHIGGNPDNYVVTPLTAPGDRVKLDITLNV
jgi:hypothetical protein